MVDDLGGFNTVQEVDDYVMDKLVRAEIRRMKAKIAHGTPATLKDFLNVQYVMRKLSQDKLLSLKALIDKEFPHEGN